MYIFSRIYKGQDASRTQLHTPTLVLCRDLHRDKNIRKKRPTTSLYTSGFVVSELEKIRGISSSTKGLDRVTGPAEVGCSPRRHYCTRKQIFVLPKEVYRVFELVPDLLCL
ncbi:uncharacterized protein LOC112588265 [Harpegnathos saltator]|uniref:uncharacterized protein LOC112588265 n=1 Tax=Harpegnathos saltator TaxID=610380 RepID=UPI000DBED219|nr:uncharacterized protein LOC112588265 [Harpegnathos saltator]